MIPTILLAAALASSPTCKKLEAELASAEENWGVLHGVNQRWYEIDVQAYTSISSPSNRMAMTRSQFRVREDDEFYERLTDRMVTLILANKCKAPDHVPTWVKKPSAEVPSK